MSYTKFRAISKIAFHGLAKDASDGQILGALRFGLLLVITLGLGATGVELLLIGHVKPVLQAFPVLLVFLALAMIIWHLFQVTSAAFVSSREQCFCLS